MVFFLRSTIEGLREIASSDVQDRDLGRLERFLASNQSALIYEL